MGRRGNKNIGIELEQGTWSHKFKPENSNTSLKPRTQAFYATLSSSHSSKPVRADGGLASRFGISFHHLAGAQV